CELVAFLLIAILLLLFFFFSSRRRHTRFSRDWSSDVCSSDLPELLGAVRWARGIRHADHRRVRREWCDGAVLRARPLRVASRRLAGALRRPAGPARQRGDRGTPRRAAVPGRSGEPCLPALPGDGPSPLRPGPDLRGGPRTAGRPPRA